MLVIPLKKQKEVLSKFSIKLKKLKILSHTKNTALLKIHNPNTVHPQ
jgi:hypothetical protein